MVNRLYGLHYKTCQYFINCLFKIKCNIPIVQLSMTNDQKHFHGGNIPISMPLSVCCEPIFDVPKINPYKTCKKVSISSLSRQDGYS